MTRQFAEILLLFPALMTTGFMLFVSGVVQGTMQDMSEAEFKRFLKNLTRRAITSPYAILAGTLTFIGMIPYWYFYGFDNRWFSAGLVLWVVASAVSKQLTLPIYSRVTGRAFTGFRKQAEIDITDAAALDTERNRLKRANAIRSGVSLASVVLMLIGLA